MALFKHSAPTIFFRQCITHDETVDYNELDGTNTNTGHQWWGTCSRQITEIKNHWARLVSGWVTR